MDTYISYISNISLGDSYKNINIKKYLGDHVTSVFDYVSNVIENKDILNHETKFSERLYWECIGQVYMNNDYDSDIDYFEIENILYNKLISELGGFFDRKDKYLCKSIDFTVSNYIDNIKYRDSLGEFNPFSYNIDLLNERKVLYTFTEDLDDLKKYFKISKESIETKNLNIGIIGKCKKDKPLLNYMKDNFGLRNLLLNVLKDKNSYSNNPVTYTDIIKIFRIRGIEESVLSDNDIRNWIIIPLKKLLYIGSNTAGYFLINTEEDLLNSYQSHYKTYRGYFKTLERHKDIAYNLGFSIEEFDLHNKY